MLVKNLMCFDLVAAVLFIMMGQRIYTFMTYFLEDSLSVLLHFFKDNLHYFHEGIYFSNNGCYGNKNMQFLSCHSNGCYEEKKLLQKLESYRFKSPL